MLSDPLPVHVRQYHLHASKVQPFHQSTNAPLSSGDERSPPLSDGSQTPARVRVLTSTARPCSVGSFSTLGSHKGHHHLPKNRAASESSALSAAIPLGTSSFQQHAIDECVSTDDPQQDGHALTACKDITGVEQDINNHELTRDERHPTYTEPNEHLLDVCQRCPPDLGMETHTTAECQTFHVVMPDTHRIQACDTTTEQTEVNYHRVSTCEEAPVYSGPELHVMNQCLKCSAEEQVAGHGIDRCEHRPVYSGPRGHVMEECSRCSVTGVPARHHTSQCPRFSVYAGPSRHSIDADLTGIVASIPDRHAVGTCEQFPIYSGPRLHDIEYCAKCPADLLGGRHLISECATYPSDETVPQHQLRQCQSCAAPGLRRHAMQRGTKHPYFGPGSGHDLRRDAANAVPEPLVEHLLPDDPVQSIDLPVGDHALAQDVEVHTEAMNVHDLGLCSTCAFDDMPLIHRLSECRKKSSEPPLSAPIPILGQQPLRRFTQWELSAQRQRTESSQSEQFYDADTVGTVPFKPQQVPDASQVKAPSRSQSLGSMLDYTKATQWLRGLMRYPESYASKLTTLPSQTPDRKHSSHDKNGIGSDPEADFRSRCSTGMSSHPSSLAAKIDDSKFKRAVSDLERLLGEAMNLAAGVANGSELERRKAYKEPSISLHSHCHSISPPENSTTSGGTILTSKWKESPCNTTGSQMKHASTFSGYIERPRLQEMVKHYSDKHEQVEAPATPAADTPVSQHIVFEIPDRLSSKLTVKKIVPHESALPTFRLIESKTMPTELPGAQKAGKDSEDVVDFQDYFSHHGNPISAVPNAADSIQATPRIYEGEHVDNNTIGQPMHGEHGISLRHRSHISLPGTQGFSLAKSHKRQPIARD